MQSPVMPPADVEIESFVYLWQLRDTDLPYPD